MTKIGILMTTYAPASIDGARRLTGGTIALQSWAKYLRADTYTFHLHVADDGTPTLQMYIEELISRWEWAGAHGVHGRPPNPAVAGGVFHSYSIQHQRGVGASLNAGLRTLFGEGIDLILYAVDDWALTQDLDIGHWAKWLKETPGFGCVRLGPPHPYNLGHVEPLTPDFNGWGLVLHPRQNFAISHRPALWHRRMFDALGWWKEDCSALECEADMSQRWVTYDAPGIVLALPHPWQHLDGIELGECQPADRP